MFGLKKSPLKVAKHSSVEPVPAVSTTSNPFDSDDDMDIKKKNHSSSQRSSSESTLVAPNFSTNPFDDDHEKGAPLSSNSLNWSERNKYKNDFRDSGGLENQSVQELENYAVYEAEETTKTVDSCLKIAEDMREDATKTLVSLHHQGEQITGTHKLASDIDHDLSRGEKLLGSLGGIFSKTWKPKKTHSITGPIITGDDILVRRNGNHLEQREKLGLTHAHKGRSKTQTPLPEPTSALQKVEVEKVKQDDKFSDLSDILGELKEMAVDMGSEIDRQNKSLDHLYDDVEEIDYRVVNANRRGRHLLKK